MVSELVRETFVVSVVYVATSMEVKQLEESKLEDDVERWLVELKYMNGNGRASL